MNIEHLKTYVYVVEQGSISKASELLNLSQSAVSQQVHSLEQQFDVTLFSRSPKGVVPTDIGAVIYQKALNILTIYDDIFAKIKQSQSASQVLRLVATPIAYSYALPCTFYHISQKYPQYHLEVESVSSNIVEEKVLGGYADLGVILGRPHCKSLLGKKSFTDRVYLVAGSRLDVPAQITKAQLYQYPLIMLLNTQRTQKQLEKSLLKAGIEVKKLRILYELESIESIKMSALNGYGLAFLPYMAIKKELYNKQLRLIDCEGLQLENNYYLIKRREETEPDSVLNKSFNQLEKVLEDTIC